MVDLFGLPARVAELEGRCGRQDGDTAGRLSDLLHLAWYLRQRDTQRCLSLLGEVERLLDMAPLSEDTLALARARASLTRAECVARLHVDLGAAEGLVAAARAGFAALADPVGEGDSCFCSSDIALLRGDMPAATRRLEEARQLYRRGDDPVRAAIADAWLGRLESYGTLEQAEVRWTAPLREANTLEHPAVRAHVACFLGGIAFQRSDFTGCITHWQEAFDNAVVAGCRWLSITLAATTGAAYANLNDLPTALEWKEKAFALAEPTGWPEALGTALSSMAETTTSLGHHARARHLFEEALTYLAKVQGVRRYVITCIAYGDLCLAMGDAGTALPWYEKACTGAVRLGHPDTEHSAMRGMAAALLALDRLDEAKAAAERALSLFADRGDRFHQIRVLQVLAGIHRAQGDVRAAAGLLERAVAIGEEMAGYQLPPDLFAELSHDQELAGDLRKALAYERRARDALGNLYERQGRNRVQAMQVRFDTERARADAEHHRLLASAEAARAAALDHANTTLELLGRIGQEITATLDSESVFQALYRHIGDLLHAPSLFIGLLDKEGGKLDVRFRMEDGRRLPPRHDLLTSDTLAAQAVRENREIHKDFREDEPRLTIPGTRPMRTALYRPLVVGERVLGVLSVQSDRESAYGPRELQVFRTLCAYGAIALANAEAYRQLDRAVTDLRDALGRLVQQEKMAALGQLVAGVAHEVNTPLGVTLSAVSLLHDSMRQMQETLNGGVLTRTSLAEHLQTGVELAGLAQRNVVRAADMVRSFKEVAVDRSNDDRRIFDLGDYLKELLGLVRPRLVQAGVRVEFDGAPPIQMDTFPGALAQVVTNLLANVADHAYPPGKAGTARVTADALPDGGVEITVADDGAGIPADILPKVFDPFFTTRRAAGNMGLGLHVAFNQVTQRLRGSIEVESQPSQGTAVRVRIPADVMAAAP
ncbi:sensor histidine kinase [Aerophototrophica crusticola]|uniref:histidine kinase n=1 Tax=Aerophototrophica crusticola TaxID=1709002 RepID=A0A858R836_9PROT|nr:sensor histidine kinase [Rhodospirillaceae bacterium B3]